MSNGPTFEAQPGWGGKLVSWLKNNLVYIIPAAAVIALVIVLATTGDNNGVPSPTEIPATVSTTPQANTLSQTVQPKDNYTLIARRAITAYIATTVAAETPGQRLYAETTLVSTMKGQSLAVGTIIPFNSVNIQKILDGYASLTSSQRTRWEAMARNVKF